ncbi:putative RNA-binding protein Luc7-like 2 isoform X1 [Argiope bruennichi]|uniref:Putative RNA-binding protein Luc7-like 1 n=1 Tax=Argiope bruennichi TaxID=94029 RepID=A0A8T0ENN6_ARGBR|nr:putative RNA-binding protein Luc7-like 2 isoform X1 [Argiope bruennichi]KAF8777513.1 putative RNA-binding protein Luc7-like 1 [Argiope bruennichi]
MSAHEQMRAMLDQLMGTGRDGENNKFKVHFTDPRVCKSFLLSCCPHDILAATRMDLGECPKLHDLALRADFENAAQKKDYFYDVDAMEHLQNFINECDRRTEQAKRRLAETQEELSAEVAAKLQRVHELAEQIGKHLAQAEKLGEEGNVEESMKIMEEVEEFKRQKSLAEQEYRNSMPASSYQQQKLRVCEVCSAYLGIHDNDRRLADHFGGKLHLGFIAIREKLKELKTEVNEKRQKGRMDRDRDYLRDRDERSRPDSSRSRRHRSRSSSRHRHRSRSDERKKRNKHRHRSSSRERHRSRDHHSHRRDRSRDKKEKKRSRSRDHRRSHSTGNEKPENNHEI